jgi:hypothetical protein|tara:strand:+ start:472 stop:855 length:384 start_codon:yes stop_codon:yes gene_type:complete
MKKILVSDDRVNSEFSLSLRKEMLDRVVSETCGEGSTVIYEYNLSLCAKYIAEEEVDALIIPRSHVAVSVIRNIERLLEGDIEIPLLKAYAMLEGRGYDTEYDHKMREGQNMYNSIGNWLKREVVGK